MTKNARDIIEELGLQPHTLKGGYFRRTYEARNTDSPGGPYTGAGQAESYYLLTTDTFSSLHQLSGDETLRFRAGDPAEMLLLHPDGQIEWVVLSDDPEVGVAEFVVPGGSWQGCRVRDGGSYALIGTTVGPAFGYDDYEEGTPVLIALYHQDARDEIEALMP